MITEKSASYYIGVNYLKAVELVGLSTDTKPTNVGNGSTLHEMDTCKDYIFDASGGEWYEQESGPGPGPEPALPDEYQRVEYLDFTPDAGFLVNIPAKHMCWTAECSSDTTESNHCIFGYRASSYTTNDFYFYTSNVNGVQSLYGWSKGTYAIFISDSAVPITIGERMTYSAAIDTGTRGKAFIGRYSEKSGEYMGWDGKFYSIKGHDLLTQELTANFVPCYKKADNTIGIYDTVAKVFYSTISGDGTVAKGPNVN